MVVAAEAAFAVEAFGGFGGLEEAELEEDLAVVDQEGDVVGSDFEDGAGALATAEAGVEEAALVGRFRRKQPGTSVRLS